MTAPAEPPEPFDAEALIDAQSAAIDLAVPPASRESVAANLRRLHAQWALIAAFDLPDDGVADESGRR
jgi:hypothetical protein